MNQILVITYFHSLVQPVHNFKSDPGMLSPCEFKKFLLSVFGWKNSLWRDIRIHAVIFYSAYVLVSLIYNFAMNIDEQKSYDEFTKYLSPFNTTLPLSMMLGFYASTSIVRWINLTLPGTYRLIHIFTALLNHNVPDGPRRIELYGRYILLMWLLTFRMVSKPFRKVYSTLTEIQANGFINETERILLASQQEVDLPLVVHTWLSDLLKDTQINGYFDKSDFIKVTDAILAFKKEGGKILNFTSRRLPVIILHVITFLVYYHGFNVIIGHGLATEDPILKLLNSYLPVHPTIQYMIFYVWFKIAVQFADPFDEENKDFCILQIFHKHCQNAERIYRTYLKYWMSNSPP